MVTAAMAKRVKVRARVEQEMGGFWAGGLQLPNDFVSIMREREENKKRYY